MASSLSTTASAAFTSVAKTTATLPPSSNLHLSNLSFRFSSNPSRLLFSKSFLPGRNSSTVVKSQLNEVAIEGSSNASATPTVKSGSPNAEAKNANQSTDVSPPALATEESISEFLNRVSSLVKLVDSRDIVELQLKQLDCELVIRKKEALPQPPSAAPVVMMQSPSQPPVMPPIPSVPAPPPSGQASAAPTPAPSLAATKSAKSSLPPLKSPMAGTFYRSPAPGEPPFVKVGDKVQKGQVLCIIEAMKLMNEIEADQSGTIVEIVAEDGKQVSVDTPLFVIEP
ncbi:biotin carboxyl carrier protein of acetyl-CoA carboxylase, chloroplastic-like [Hibiscus syriacus]|uniref:biotin carboxyl carrier protein of acetyl-CoA carboxylase, chloroplastic-like n=1 Tax=Hibiscus syriacus TaxID=106335 RepID=UPI0019209096|nr:biotin carboxyl carrier protein of acetyl-CoA carboxylase, chloroplastic-like [Hibiscus syriacus]